MAGKHYSNGAWRTCTAQEGACPLKDDNGDPVPHATTKDEMERVEAQHSISDPHTHRLSKNTTLHSRSFDAPMSLVGVDKRVAKAEAFAHFVDDDAQESTQKWLETRKAQNRRNGPYASTTLQFTNDTAQHPVFVTNNQVSHTYELHNLDGSPVQGEHTFVTTSMGGESDDNSPVVTTTFTDGRRDPNATETIVRLQPNGEKLVTVSHFNNRQLAAKGCEPAQYSMIGDTLTDAHYTTPQGRNIGQWNAVDGFTNYDHEAAGEYVRKVYTPLHESARIGETEAAGKLDTWLKFNKPLLDAYTSEETYRQQQEKIEQSRHRVRNFLRGNR